MKVKLKNIIYKIKYAFKIRPIVDFYCIDFGDSLTELDFFYIEKDMLDDEQYILNFFYNKIENIEEQVEVHVLITDEDDVLFTYKHDDPNENYWACVVTESGSGYKISNELHQMFPDLQVRI